MLPTNASRRSHSTIFPVNEVNIKPASPTSSIGGLKPSTLQQLKIGKVHRRRVVNGTLCSKTLCTKTHNGLTVVNVFEDEEGHATPIYLSNAMEGNGGSAQAQRYYPQDSKVAVKEPYLTRLPDGEVVLLVEKMTDLVFLWVPDYVEESEGSKGNGEFNDGREVFAMEKKDGMPNDLTEDVDSGNVPVTEEEVKSSNASRELKFEDVMEAKGDNGKIEEAGKDQEMSEADNVNIKGGRKDQETSEVDNVKMEEDRKDQETGEVDNVKIEQDGKYQESAAVVEDERETKKVGKTNHENGTDEKGGIVSEEKVEEVAMTERGSRDLSMKDILSMQKSENDSGGVDGVKVGEGEDAKAIEVNRKGSEVVVEKGENEDIAKQEIQQEKPVGDVDADATPASLRVKGNALFARGEYNKALDVYMRGAEKAQLDKLKKEEVLCLSNRAEVWLRLCRNQAALDDAEAALKVLRELEDDDAKKGDLALAKALFRKGRALMGLHKYEDAIRVLQEVLAKAPADRQLREAAMKCRDRLQHVLKPGKRQRAAMNRKKSASFMVQ